MRVETTQHLHQERYRSYLIVLARTLLKAAGPLRHKIDASDVVQEALLQAHVALGQFKGATEAELAAWLRAILANKLADAWRHLGRRKRDAALEESYRETLDESAVRLQRFTADQTSPSQKVLRHERALLLAECLVKLPEDQKAAVKFHHLQGLSVAEIAEQMNCSKASVAGLLRRGLKGLREHLKEKGLE